MTEKITFNEFSKRLENILTYERILSKQNDIKSIRHWQEKIAEEAEKINLANVRTTKGGYFPEELSRAIKDYNFGKIQWNEVLELKERMGID